MKTMKKLSVATIVAISLAACQQETFEGRHDSNNYYASVETFVTGTKTALGDNRSVVWSSDDRIAIFEGKDVGQAYQVLDSYVGKSSGEFAEVEGLVTEGTGAAIDGTIAVYPFNEDIIVTSGDNGDYVIEGVTFPSEQKYNAGSFSEEAFPMVAVTSDKNLSFKNVGGLLKLSLTGSYSVSSITLTGNSGELLSGPATVTLGADGIPSVTMSDDASTSVTLVCDPAVVLDPETATDFYISIPPTAFEGGFEILVNNSDGNEYRREAEKYNKVHRASILTMPKLEQEELTHADLKVIYTDTYIEDSHSFLFDSGDFVIFTPDSLSGYTLYIDSINLGTGNLSDNGIIAQCDSLMRPLYFIHNNINYYFSYVGDTVDLTIIENNTRTTINGLEYGDSVQTKGSTEGYFTNLTKSDYAVGMIGLALAYKDKGKGGFCIELAKFLSIKSLDLPGGNLIVEDLIVLGVNAADAFLTKGKLPIIGCLLAYADLLKDCAAFITKRYIGDVTPILVSLEQNSGDSVSLTYQIQGTDSNKEVPFATVYYRSKYSALSKGEWELANTRTIKSDNIYNEIIDDLYKGTYEFRVIVYPGVYYGHPLLQQYYGFKTSIKTIEIKDPECTTGEVSETTSNSAVIKCTYNYVPDDGQCQVILSWDEGYKVIDVENREGEQEISLTDLEPNTTYSYCASIDYEGGPVNGETKEFTTRPQLPTIKIENIDVLYAVDQGDTHVALGLGLDLACIKSEEFNEQSLNCTLLINERDEAWFSINSESNYIKLDSIYLYRNEWEYINKKYRNSLEIKIRKGKQVITPDIYKLEVILDPKPVNFDVLFGKIVIEDDGTRIKYGLPYCWHCNNGAPNISYHDASTFPYTYIRNLYPLDLLQVQSVYIYMKAWSIGRDNTSIMQDQTICCYDGDYSSLQCVSASLICWDYGEDSRYSVDSARFVVTLKDGSMFVRTISLSPPGRQGVIEGLVYGQEAN